MRVVRVGVWPRECGRACVHKLMCTRLTRRMIVRTTAVPRSLGNCKPSGAAAKALGQALPGSRLVKLEYGDHESLLGLGAESMF